MHLYTVLVKSEQESEEKHIVDMFLKIYEYGTKSTEINQNTPQWCLQYAVNKCNNFP